VLNSRFCIELDRGILSQVLFKLYVDDMMKELQLIGNGCYIGKGFIGCIHWVFADDLLFSSPFIIGLQRMIDLFPVW